MPYYTEEQIKQARSIDLLTYLHTYEPTELIHVRGNIYCTREHDSLKISNGKWMWWSRGFGGTSALDYLVKVKGLQFMDAMEVLTNGEANLHNNDTKICRKDDCYGERKLLLPEKAETNLEVIQNNPAYAGIDKYTINKIANQVIQYETNKVSSISFAAGLPGGVIKLHSAGKTKRCNFNGLRLG